MEEYNKNDKVEDVKENISAVEEFTDTEKENEQDLLLKQGAVNSLERMFKLWWIPLIVMVLSFFAFIPGALLIAFGKKSADTLTMIAGGGILFFAVLFIAGSACISAIASVILLYRYWKFLPAEEAYTTPAKAVGYLFIPVFNLYWAFVAYCKLSRSYDKILGRSWSSSSVVVCIYAVLFSLSALFGFLSPVAVQFIPESSPFAQLLSIITVPNGLLYIVMMCRLQNTVREYLRGPVSNWKNNPDFSRVPIVVGIIAGIILNIILSFFMVASVCAKSVYDVKKKNFQHIHEQQITVEHTHIHTHHK